MPRKPLIYTNEHPYHVTGRSNNRDWFDLPLEECSPVFTKVIVKTKEAYGIKIHAFVLMNNHFHMVLSTPQSNISQAMRYFMTETSRGIRCKALRVNHVYGGRYRPSLIMTSEHFAHTLKYVYRNPVKAGVTQLVEDYPWSSIAQPRPPMAAEMEPVETGHDEYLPQGDQLLKWLNEHYTEEQERLLSRALHRPVFGVKPDRSSGRRPYLPLP